ncbi:hypothetical protein GCK32_021166, partial [Trichostrongylus colubriformis]
MVFKKAGPDSKKAKKKNSKDSSDAPASAKAEAGTKKEARKK